MIGEWPEDLVAIAEVLSPQGNRGEVKAASLTSRASRFGELRTVTAWKNATRRLLTVMSWRAWRAFIILGFAEIGGIDEAEALRGAMICVRRGERAVLPPNEYYHDDLLGLTVVDESGLILGRVASIAATGANDVLGVETPDGRELLLPAVASMILRVDLGAGRLLVRPSPGLLD